MAESSTCTWPKATLAHGRKQPLHMAESNPCTWPKATLAHVQHTPAATGGGNAFCGCQRQKVISATKKITNLTKHHVHVK